MKQKIEIETKTIDDAYLNRLERTVILLEFSPDFVWCRYHRGEHSSPSQNLSPYISLFHQQEHFWPPSHDGLSDKELNHLERRNVKRLLGYRVHFSVSDGLLQIRMEELTELGS